MPAECLVLTMKANQKYFPLLDAGGRLTSRFLVVSNISPANPFRVVEGNERVVRLGLADAKFFFEQDRKKTLELRLPRLDEVVYHNKLGSQGERVGRVRTIARALGARLGGEVLAAQADEAARLAKADLLTDMVGEFPELQGVMGRYYAQAEGIDDDIAWAVEEHYRPRFAGDGLPRTWTGTVVALADKLETLVGLFSIGQLPTGDRDPFALRRHALGIVRLLMENAIELPVRELVELGGRAVRADRRGAPADGRQGDRLHRRPAWPAAARPGRERGRGRGRHLPSRRQPARDGARARRGARLRVAARGGEPGGGQQAGEEHPRQVGRRAGGRRRRGRPGAAGRAGRARTAGGARRSLGPHRANCMPPAAIPKRCRSGPR